MAETVIQSGHKEGPMKRLQKEGDVPEEKKQAFLDALADSCNVKAAAEASGFTPSTAYKLRQRDPAFAAAWREALEIGYVRLEMALVDRAIRTIEQSRDDAPDALPAVRVEAAGEATRLRVTYRAGLAAEANGVPEAIRQGLARMIQHLHEGRSEARQELERAPPAIVAALWQPWRRMGLGR